MTLSFSRCLQSLAFVAALAAPLAPALALVGAEPDSRFADRVAMVLDPRRRQGRLLLGSGADPAHSSDRRPLSETPAGHGRSIIATPRGAAVIIPIDAAIAHPLYRADAIKARVKSIDLALIRTTRPACSPLCRRSNRERRPAANRRVSDRFRLWRGRRGRLVVRRRAAQREAFGSRAGVHGPHLGGRSDWKGGRSLQWRFRRANLVGGRIGRDCDRPPGRRRRMARLRRLDAGTAACAAQGLDREDRAPTR